MPDLRTRAVARLRRAAIAAAAVLVWSHAASASGQARSMSDPQLPRAYVDTTLVPSSGATVLVHAGANLQAALDAAQPGDAILLDPGATFTGQFILPAKVGNEWITIRPAVPEDRLPPPGTRADPSYAAAMPKLESASGPALTAAPGAHHYRLIGIEILSASRHLPPEVLAEAQPL